MGKKLMYKNCTDWADWHFFLQKSLWLIMVWKWKKNGCTKILWLSSYHTFFCQDCVWRIMITKCDFAESTKIVNWKKWGIFKTSEICNFFNVFVTKNENLGHFG